MVKVFKPLDFTSTEDAIDYIVKCLYEKYAEYEVFGNVNFTKLKEPENAYMLNINNYNFSFLMSLNKKELDNELERIYLDNYINIKF